ncbi:unnamed protein product, partial [Meganyctiphanes norvegica]
MYRVSAEPSNTRHSQHSFEKAVNGEIDKINEEIEVYKETLANQDIEVSVKEEIEVFVEPVLSQAVEETVKEECEYNQNNRAHTGLKAFEYNQCGTTSSRKSNLETNLMIHTGEKPHKCNQCNKDFLCNSNLIIHIRTHTGEQPF